MRAKMSGLNLFSFLIEPVELIKLLKSNLFTSIAINAVSSFIKVTITDTGIGIAKSKHADVFEPFNRLGQENSNIQGAGIGLVVTKDLLEFMNGKIGFEIKEYSGSTFWFELPTIATQQAITTS